MTIIIKISTYNVYIVNSKHNIKNNEKYKVIIYKDQKLHQ